MKEPWRTGSPHALTRASHTTPLNARVVARYSRRTGVVWWVVSKYHGRGGVLVFDLESTTSSARRVGVMPGDYLEVPE